MTVKKLVLVVSAILFGSLSLHASESISSSIQSNTPMPLPFTKNMGQWPDSILFRASANGATMWFTKNGIWYQFFRKVEKAGATAVGGLPIDLWAADVPSAPTVSDGNPRFEQANVLLNDSEQNNVAVYVLSCYFGV